MFNKIQHPCLIKKHRKLGIEGNFLNLVKGIHEKLIANIVLNVERLSTLPKMRNNVMVPTSSSAIQYCTGSCSQLS